MLRFIICLYWSLLGYRCDALEGVAVRNAILDALTVPEPPGKKHPVRLRTIRPNYNRAYWPCS